MSDGMVFENDEGEELPPELTGGQPPAPAATDEFLFSIGEGDGQQQLPLSKLTLDHVKPWYEAHANMNKWQAANTQRAQELAKEREEFGKDQEKHKTSLQQMAAWEQFFNGNQGLQNLVSAYIQGKIPREMLEQIIGQQVSAAPTAQSRQDDPRVQALLQRIDSLESRLNKGDEQQQERQMADERERLLGEMAKDPKFVRDQFESYMDKTTAGMDKMENLYQLVWKAQQWDAAQNGAASRAAAVERGAGQPATQLPENIDVSKETVDSLFEKFKDSAGIKPEEGVDIYS